MLDYKTIIRLKQMGLNNLAIANGAKCKWDSVERVLTRCNAVWGSVDGVPEGLSNEEIVADLDKTRIPLEIAIENLAHDFNIGTIVRNANAFNVARVHIIGKRKYNRRGAMVTDKYLHIDHFATVDDFSVVDEQSLPVYLLSQYVYHVCRQQPPRSQAARKNKAQTKLYFDLWLRVGWYFAGIIR